MWNSLRIASCNDKFGTIKLAVWFVTCKNLPFTLRNQSKAGKWGLLKFTTLFRVGINSGRS